VTKKEN